MQKTPDPENPAECMATVAAMRTLADQLERQAVRVALKQGWSWAHIAEALGITRQAAHKRHARHLRQEENSDV